MGTIRRQLLFNWCDAHSDLKRLVENDDPDGAMDNGNGRGWTYLTFFPQGARAEEMLYDIDQISKIAKDNSYYLPRDVVTQHNKVVLTVYPNGATGTSPLAELYSLIAAFAARYDDLQQYPSHGFYGKFGGVYERPEKGRVLAIYSVNDDALLAIHESLEELVAESRARGGIKIDLHFSNGLSAIPRMLHGFDDPEYRRSGAEYYRITAPAQFAILLDQARQDHEMYRFD